MRNTDAVGEGWGAGGRGEKGGEGGEEEETGGGGSCSESSRETKKTFLKEADEKIQALFEVWVFRSS